MNGYVLETLPSFTCYASLRRLSEVTHLQLSSAQLSLVSAPTSWRTPCHGKWGVLLKIIKGAAGALDDLSQRLDISFPLNRF